MRQFRHRVAAEDRDSGTALILAIVFVFVIAIVLVALGGMAAGALRTTTNLRSERTTIEDAENAVTLTMQYYRYNYGPPCTATLITGCIPSEYSSTSPAPPSCLPSGSIIPSADTRVGTKDPVAVYCTENVNPFSTQTRTFDFYACPSSVTTAASCTGFNVTLHAEVSYNDLNSQSVDGCTASSPTNCGESVMIDIWDVTGADN